MGNDYSMCVVEYDYLMCFVGDNYLMCVFGDDTLICICCRNRPGVDFRSHHGLPRYVLQQKVKAGPGSECCRVRLGFLCSTQPDETPPGYVRPLRLSARHGGNHATHVSVRSPSETTLFLEMFPPYYKRLRRQDRDTGREGGITCASKRPR